MSNYDDNIREKTEHLTPNAPSGGYTQRNDPLVRDHYQSNSAANSDLEGNTLARTQTGMTLTPEMFERMYLNPKMDVYVCNTLAKTDN